MWKKAHDTGRKHEWWVWCIICIMKFSNSYNSYKYSREVLLKTHLNFVTHGVLHDLSRLTTWPAQTLSFLSVFTGTWHSSRARAWSTLEFETSGTQNYHSDSTWGLTHNAWKEQRSGQRDLTWNCRAAADYLCCFSKLSDLLHLVFPLKNKTNTLVIVLQLPSVLWNEWQELSRALENSKGLSQC